MGMAQLAAIIIKQGHEVQIYDHNAWRADDDQIKEVLTSDKWDLVELEELQQPMPLLKNCKTYSKSSS